LPLPPSHIQYKCREKARDKEMSRFPRPFFLFLIYSLEFSKSLEHLKAAVDLYMTFFNFCRVHKTLRVTPAMESKLTDHVWNIRELICGIQSSSPSHE
jgi:hypothetical protein